MREDPRLDVDKISACLQAHYGLRVLGETRKRGLRALIRRQALYTLAPRVAEVPMTVVTAHLSGGAGWTTIAAPKKIVRLSLNGMPAYLVSGPEVLPATISPNGDGRDDATVFRWVSGDVSRCTLQVYGLDGRLLRTVTTDASVRGGIGSLRWDGLLKNAQGRLAPAPTGTYWLRLTVFGPDGRKTHLQKKVNVRL
jgi:hypothetical protein